MIESIDQLPEGVVGMRAVGTFTVDDFTTVIEPALDKFSGGHELLRLLLFLGPDFTGFGDGAWSELTSEIRHTHFHKGAVVTDDGHVRTALKMLKWVLHGDVRTFRNDEYDKAARWITA